MNPTTSQSLGLASLSTASQSTATRVRNNDNPFLEPPARKLFKQQHDSNSLSGSGSQSVATTTTTATTTFPRTQTFAQSRKPQRLVLTRVLPSSSSTASTHSVPTTASRATTKPAGGASSTGLSLHSPIETSYLNTLAIPSASATRTPIIKDSYGFAIPSVPVARYDPTPQHPSTTPKIPPNRHYFDFIAKASTSGPAPKLNLSSVDSSSITTPAGEEEEASWMREQVDGRSQGQELELEQGGQEQEQERPAKTLFPVDSAMMTVARRSIMQHATSSPSSIFRKLSNNRTGAQPSTLSQSRPLTTNTPQPPTAPATVATTSQDKVAVIADSVEKGSKDSRKPSGDLAFTFVSAPKPNASAVTGPTPEITETAAASSSSRVFARSVLDLSNTSEPKVQIQRKAIPSTPAHAIVSTSTNTDTTHRIYPNKAHQPPSVITKPMENSSATENRTPAATTDVDMSDAGADDSGGTKTATLVFDIRAALRMDSARTQYQLPSLVASLSPPPSPRRRPTPYSIPSANDREALRIRRMPRFKARPLNPKVFTSAGDLGVPRIPKAPLTVPISPVFSQPRVRNAVAASGLTKEDTKSAAATRLKEMVKAGIVKKLDKGPVSSSSSSMNTAKTAVVTQPAWRIVSARNRANARQDDKDLGGIGTGARRIAAVGNKSFTSKPLGSSALTWISPLVVPSVDQTRAVVVGTDSDVHAESSSTSTYQTRIATALATDSVTQGASKLRRPATTTKPVPFHFATTELQRRRMLYQPTADSSLASAAVTDSFSKARSQSRANALSLEDLMSDA